jgi:hypothetical protein
MERCKRVYQLFEVTKPRPLRRILTTAGVTSAEFEGFGSVKLLASVMQLCDLCLKAGIGVNRHTEQVQSLWTERVALNGFKCWFGLVDLRQAASHSLGGDRRPKVLAALDTFGIEEQHMVAGWGAAIDRVFDQVTRSFEDAAGMVASVVGES